jgi:hypothetical protein
MGQKLQAYHLSEQAFRAWELSCRGALSKLRVAYPEVRQIPDEVVTVEGDRLRIVLALPHGFRAELTVPPGHWRPAPGFPPRG